ncbi:MAG: aldo/keto reductase [Clostridium tyrobutyricum]|uniref:aldo/keto reductase n=2 Tax=Clostridium tyrobutyricum TaxID=1519 RepID=UPI0018AB0D07|nr:aldo/keto reductase [Clostridium tyrobutyricum]MBV4439612.1 aldo/keto reductase [Clostridium tyrobutyricum]MCH4236715.1 aldo/keto reductase [Clostridium tyrobutyricum]MCH4259265.1 aldo/keto reductase [Clostridium tyrobutyricum]MCI1239979.1 aldo/keto reductase [Clostridium tyrobutyricum]MCI1651529.1 aldo/keto reductase [Clostridium tyrobutyricum]
MQDKVMEIELNDGLRVPSIGFGTYKLNGMDGANAIKEAIDIGYRLIDSAFNYENEGAVGQAVKQSPVSRDELLITSKLPGRHHSYKEAIVTVQESLFRAGLDYYDLYLIHWPNPRVDLYVEAWQALIESKKRGFIRSIGVCNFLPEHIERLIKETGVTPSINQIELHPYFNQEKQRKWNKEHNIVTQSWSPLGRANSILKEEKIGEIAKAHKKTISQIILRWHIQLGAIPIPKATSKQHQSDNLNIFDFELSDVEMKNICKLTCKSGRTNNQDPAVYEEF